MCHSRPDSEALPVRFEIKLFYSDYVLPIISFYKERCIDFPKREIYDTM